MAYTTMKVWGSETLTASDMTTYLTNNIEYLYGQVQGLVFSGVNLRRTSDQTLTTATNTDVTWQSEDLDVGGWWSSGATITVPASAIPTGYTTIAIAVSVALRFATNSSGGRAALLLVNGAEVDNAYVGAASDTVTGVTLVTATTVVAADTIKIQARQNAGVNLAMDVAKVRIYRIGPTS